MPRGIPNRPRLSEYTRAVHEREEAELPAIEGVKAIGPGWLPVRLNRNYRPMRDYLLVNPKTGGTEEPPKVDGKVFDVGLEFKLGAGAIVQLPIEEAKTVVRKGIATRFDEYPA